MNDQHAHAHAHHGHAAPGDAAAVKDPVCGMTVDPAKALAKGLTHAHAGDTYYFCNPRCKERFAAAPERYLKPDDAGAEHAHARAAAEPAGTIWTCPMHPEIRRDAPGPCPICGMALEPLSPTAEEGENVELVDMTRRFWISAALTAPLLWSMVGELVPAVNPMRLFPHAAVAWAQLVLATPVVVWGGWPFFVRGWQSLVTRNLNMFTLIALGTGAAFAFSLVAGSMMA